MGPEQKLTMGGQDTRKRLEKLIIFQLPATLNVEYHAAQHGLSDARNEHRIRRNRRRSRWAHCRSGSEKRILDTRLTEYRIRGSEITNGALDLLGKVLEANMVVLKCKRTVDVTDFRALRNTFGNSRLTLIRDTLHLITGTLKDPAMRLALKEADRLEIHEWVDEVAVRNANAAWGHADLSELDQIWVIRMLDEGRDGRRARDGKKATNIGYVGSIPSRAIDTTSRNARARQEEAPPAK